MSRNTHTLSCLEQLAIRWSLIGKLCVVFARQVLLAEKMRASSGAPKAELLEAALYAALVQLSAEIAQAAPRTQKDRAALTHLKTVHGLLGVMALMFRQLKADFAARAEWLAGLCGPPPMPVSMLPAARAAPPTFLDSS